MSKEEVAQMLERLLAQVEQALKESEERLNEQ